MASMSSPLAEALSSRQRAALDCAPGDLDRILGTRLRSVVAYGLGDAHDGDPTTTSCARMALVDASAFEISTGWLPLARGWQARGLAVPLLLTAATNSRARSTSFRSSTAASSPATSSLRGDEPVRRRSPSPTPIAAAAASGRPRATSFTCARAFSRPKATRARRRADRRVGAGVPRAARNIVTARARRCLAARRHGRSRAGGCRRGHRRRPGGADPRSAGARSAAASPIPSPLLARYIDASERIWRFVDGWRRVTPQPAPGRRAGALSAAVVIAARAGRACARVAQPPPPLLTAPRQRLRQRHRRDERAGARSAHPRAEGGDRRRRRRRHGADVPAVRRHRGVRRQDVRERRQGHRREGQGQRRC